jgi:gag-polypeptide of LTR copia-type/Zinc knuckle
VKGFGSHFDGTLPKPTVSLPPLAGEQDALNQWLKDEHSTKALLTHHIPDSKLIWVHAKDSLKDRWDLIVKEYTQKGTFSQAELHSHFMDLKCPDKGNVHEFLDELHVEKERLATYGVIIEDKDYCSTIITSLPPHLWNFALSILVNVRLHAASKTVDPDELTSLISEEYDHGVSQCLWHSATRSSKVEAMPASSSWKVKHKCKPCSVCWNCGEKGHFKDKCPKPLKDAKNDSPKKGGSALAAVEPDLEDGAAFFAECKW